MRFGVLILPDFDQGKNISGLLKTIGTTEIEQIWYKNNDFANSDSLFITGGTLWAEHVMKNNPGEIEQLYLKLEKASLKGLNIFGFGEGFRLLCQARLLPGVFEENPSKVLISKNVYLRVDNSQSPLTQLIDKDQIYKLPISCTFGKYCASEEMLASMRQNRQILFRYCDVYGKVTEKINYTGSVDNIAAICNENRNVFGLMAYPDRAWIKDSEIYDGTRIIKSVVNYTTNQ